MDDVLIKKGSTFGTEDFGEVDEPLLEPLRG